MFWIYPLLLLYFKGTLYIAHFSSIPTMNNNQTVVVDYLQETSQGTLTAYKGEGLGFFPSNLDSLFSFRSFCF